MLSSQKIFWTEHAMAKMRQYGLSKSKLLKLLYRPERKEQGIVPETMAVMATNKIFNLGRKDVKVKKVPGEIWLMYRDLKEKRIIISAWRYPGVSKPGESIPVPLDIRQEIFNEYK